ncbi:MAG: amino acid ABC transporter substrate-binding protein [Lachnospiraceae bacterium]|nr:amino acid ABC transporter substrate-binding protein [Lachnospiraceae bacterium]
MKKLLAAILALVMVLSLAACGEDAETQTDTQDAGQTTEAQEAEKVTFTVGFDAECPPFGFMDGEGGYTGFDLELAEAACAIYGWELVKTPIDWDAKDVELNGGAIDCIWNGFTINGRENDYEWSIPYCDNSQVIVAKASAGITTLADLAGKTVGVQAASAALDVLQDPEGRKDIADTFAALQEFPNYNNAFLDLEAGVIDAVAMDIGVANYQIATREGEYVIVEEALSSEQYGVGFKLGNTELRDKINDALKQLTEDGTVAALAEKYEITDMIILK